MKKIIFAVLVLVAIQQWDTISGFVNPPPDYSAINSGEVVLYATSWCGYCAKTREFLAKHNVRYIEYDIEKSSEGKEQYEALGKKGVPVLLIGGELVHGYNPKVMSRLLRL